MYSPRSIITSLVYSVSKSMMQSVFLLCSQGFNSIILKGDRKQDTDAIKAIFDSFYDCCTLQWPRNKFPSNNGLLWSDGCQPQTCPKTDFPLSLFENIRPFQVRPIPCSKYIMAEKRTFYVICSFLSLFLFLSLY